MVERCPLPKEIWPSLLQEMSPTDLYADRLTQLCEDIYVSYQIEITFDDVIWIDKTKVFVIQIPENYNESLFLDIVELHIELYFPNMVWKNYSLKIIEEWIWWIH